MIILGIDILSFPIFYAKSKITTYCTNYFKKTSTILAKWTKEKVMKTSIILLPVCRLIPSEATSHTKSKQRQGMSHNRYAMFGGGRMELTSCSFIFTGRGGICLILSGISFKLQMNIMKTPVNGLQQIQTINV